QFGFRLALARGTWTLRFRVVYFAIASLLLPLAPVNIILIVPTLVDGQGIILNLGFEPLNWFYTIWTILGIEVGVTYWVTHGRIRYGRRAINSVEDAAKRLVIDAARHKLSVFSISDPYE